MEKPHGIKAFSAVLIASSLLLPPLGEAQTQKKPAKTPVVIMDPVTQSPRIMRDIEEYVPGGEGGKLQLSQSNAAKTATDYLAKNEARLGVRTADLKLRRVRKAGKFWVTTFTQHYRNIPVYKSRVGLVALGNGKIVTLGSNFDKGISLDVKPTVTFEEAVTAAASSLKLRDPQAARTTRKELVVFPNPKGQKERYSLAWRFFLATKKPDAFHFKTFFVDAHKGRVLKSHDVLVADTLKGRVTGAIWPSTSA